MPEYTQTEGEYLVGITFNPSKNENVNHIKQTIAGLIDYIKIHGKDGRCSSICVTNLEDAAMWGVKSVTKEPRI
jgi:hypothetical protein